MSLLVEQTPTDSPDDDDVDAQPSNGKPAKARRTIDPELKAIDEIVETMDTLTEPAQGRTLSYLLSRYEYIDTRAMEVD